VEQRGRAEDERGQQLGRYAELPEVVDPRLHRLLSGEQQAERRAADDALEAAHVGEVELDLEPGEVLQHRPPLRDQQLGRRRQHLGARGLAEPNGGTQPRGVLSQLGGGDE